MIITHPYAEICARALFIVSPFCFNCQYYLRHLRTVLEMDGAYASLYHIKSSIGQLALPSLLSSALECMFNSCT